MTRVSIVKVLDIDDENNIREGVKKAVDLVGGMNSVVKTGDRVIIKPNLFGPREASKGATTNLVIVREIAKEVIECGGNPIIAEGPFRFYNADLTFQVLGFKILAEELDIDLVNLNAAQAVEIDVPNGRALKTIKIPKVILNADALINVPKMKTHHLTTVTLGMKNMKGVMPGKEKQESHVHGIHQSIVDLNKAVRSDLVVADGTIAMEGMGPTFGDPVDLGVIVAGRNVVDVDKVCCMIMGIDSLRVEHLRLACEEGLHSENLEMVGDPLLGVLREFKVPYESKAYLYAHSVAEKMDRVVNRISGKNILPFLSGSFGKKPRIDQGRCVKCGICEKVCIVSPPAVNVRAGRIDYRRCVDCLLCMEQCPQNAISVRGLSLGKRIR